MEIFGLIFMTGAALCGSTVLAVTVWFFKRIRPLSAGLWITPPFGIFSLILIRWFILDRSPICGPDPEWDRCPSRVANAIGYAGWLFAVVVLFSAASLIQRTVTNYVNRHINQKLASWKELPATASEETK